MDVDIHKDILQWVHNPVPALALLNHPRNNRITGVTGAGFLVLSEDGSKSLQYTGLLKPLAATLWPQELTLKPIKGGKKKKTSATLLGSDRRHRNAQMAATGRMRGLIIHQQILDLVIMGVEAFHRKHQQAAHPWADSVLRLLINHGLRPLIAEKCVFDDDLKIATAIDLVCVDKSGELHFIELKTGYSSVAEWLGAHGGNMRAPLHKVLGNTAQNRAKVQCMMGAMMAIQGHGIDADFHCWVVHAHDNGADLIPIHPTWVFQFVPLITVRIMQWKQFKKKTKKVTVSASVF